MPRARLLVLSCLVAALAAQQSPAPAPGFERFFPPSRSFHVDVPTGWRQVSPGALKELRSRHRDLPAEFDSTEPGLFFVVGPLERWLTGPFDHTFLYVVEQDQEWYTQTDFAAQIAANWRNKSSPDGPRHEVAAVVKESVGPARHEVITCIRTTVQSAGRPTLRSLDVYAPTGGRQVSIAFTCPADRFEQRLPEFRRMVATLTFARRSRGEQKLSDRLWTPLIAGAIVALILLALYKRNKAAAMARES